jgi:hypothetical protein
MKAISMFNSQGVNHFQLKWWCAAGQHICSRVLLAYRQSASSKKKKNGNWPVQWKNKGKWIARLCEQLVPAVQGTRLTEWSWLLGKLGKGSLRILLLRLLGPFVRITDNTRYQRCESGGERLH